MKRFVKNPSVGDVFLPGIGKLVEGKVFVGNSFSQYSPRFLVEIPEAPEGVPLESRPPRGPVLLTEPSNPAAAPEPEPVKVEEGLLTESDAVPADPPKRPRGRPRKVV